MPIYYIQLEGLINSFDRSFTFLQVIHIASRRYKFINQTHVYSLDRNLNIYADCVWPCRFALVLKSFSFFNIFYCSKNFPSEISVSPIVFHRKFRPDNFAALHDGCHLQTSVTGVKYRPLGILLGWGAKVKPLYSEHHRDRKQFSAIGRCPLYRG